MKRLSPKYPLLLFLFAFGVGVQSSRAQQTDSLTSPANVTLPMQDTVPHSAGQHQPDTSILSYPQVPYSLSNPKQYELAGITVSGSQYLDQSLLASITGLVIGQKIVLPGDNLSDALRKIWNQGLFSNAEFLINKIDGDKIYLDLHVTERPRLQNFYFRGVSKTQSSELKDKTGLTPGRVVTGNTTRSAIGKIRKYFVDKGYSDVEISITERPNTTTENAVDLIFNIRKGSKVKVSQIFFAGNDHVTDSKLKKKMKGTHEMTRLTLHSIRDTPVFGGDVHPDFHEYMQDWGFLSFSKTKELLDPYVRLKFFSSAKFSQTKYEEDKDKILSYYNSLGYRDAILEKDTVYNAPDGNFDVDIKVQEGKKYYFGDIVWKGNTKYSDSVLNLVVGIKRGDVYNLDLLQKKLGITPTQEGGDVSSLYLDDGYLFFHVTPVETAIHGDTIDYEMRMAEGPQADINKVTITGNDKTNEHVVRRELRTVPGDKFNRAAIIRSQREISQLGFFDPEKVAPNVQPNIQDGTVDIGWSVQEKPSDQLELSAGWGGYIGLTGTLGMTFNNFSLRNITNKSAWRPLPSGDGQKLSVRVQSNGKYYSSYNFSFTEPWLGGKKRNPFTVSFYKTKYTNPDYSGGGLIPVFNNNSYLKTIGATISLGKQLQWPDDFFSLQYAVSFQQFKLKDYHNDPIFTPSGFYDGVSNNINLRITLDRNSTDQPLFPRTGSHFTLFGQFTPPYSLFDENKDYSSLTPQEKFRFIEYQKYRFTGEWYMPIGSPHGTDAKTFVLKVGAKFGFLGQYNPNVPLSPFERFELGGDGLSNYEFYGKDIISQRGYPVYYTSDPRINPDNANPPSDYQGFTIFNKYTVELRYPISLNPSSTIYALGFFDAANGYNGFKDYNPFRLRRDAGIGMRFFLPMFGLLGFDYGIGFDRLRHGGGLKDATKFSFMLGYEPD